MLVLSRKPGERIAIDGGVTITVVKLDANRVRLGIEAPAGVAIMRSELLRRGIRSSRISQMGHRIRHGHGAEDSGVSDRFQPR